MIQTSPRNGSNIRKNFSCSERFYWGSTGVFLRGDYPSSSFSLPLFPFLFLKIVFFAIRFSFFFPLFSFLSSVFLKLFIFWTFNICLSFFSSFNFFLASKAFTLCVLALYVQVIGECRSFLKQSLQFTVTLKGRR